MKKKILLILSLTVATNAMALDADEARKAYEVRHSIFELLLWNVAPLAGMVKNEVPFDADRLDARARESTVWRNLQRSFRQAARRCHRNRTAQAVRQ